LNLAHRFNGGRRKKLEAFEHLKPIEPFEPFKQAIKKILQLSLEDFFYS
jgi:hypothetical protein